VRAENDLLKPVSTNQRPHSGYITVTLARFSKILAALFRAQLTGRGNEGRVVLYSSDPALAGLKERL